jgi:hypothetical protein
MSFPVVGGVVVFTQPFLLIRMQMPPTTGGGGLCLVPTGNYRPGLPGGIVVR